MIKLIAAGLGVGAFIALGTGTAMAGSNHGARAVPLPSPTVPSATLGVTVTQKAGAVLVTSVASPTYKATQVMTVVPDGDH